MFYILDRKNSTIHTVEHIENVPKGAEIVSPIGQDKNGKDLFFLDTVDNGGGERWQIYEEIIRETEKDGRMRLVGMVNVDTDDRGRELSKNLRKFATLVHQHFQRE